MELLTKNDNVMRKIFIAMNNNLIKDHKCETGIRLINCCVHVVKESKLEIKGTADNLLRMKPFATFAKA